MSDEEDYLSDKFLVEATASSSQPKTYAQRRQESSKQSRIKSVQNQLKSRRQREQDSREEGLRKNLFERATEDNEGEGNKALQIMLRMGFKMGHSLGPESAPSPGPGESLEGTERRNTHGAEPLPLNEWSGRRGIGSGKRPRSPGASDRLEKMAKMAEDASKEDFRDFARRGYEERRAEACLTRAQWTCRTLDEMAGITFNVLWINPDDAESIPTGLMDAILDSTQGTSLVPSGQDNEAARLRDQMRADALQPVAGDEDDDALDGTNNTAQQGNFEAKTVEEAVCFFRLEVQDRLSSVLTYLRDKHAYCFWCGSKYEDKSDLAKRCPGPSEDDHD